MKVRNVHEREFPATAAAAGALIDSLASPDDRLWPLRDWPRMRFDRPLGVGADGGHGPIRYVVEDYAPGRSVRFRFTGPPGFNGWHGYECIDRSPGTVLLRHALHMETSGLALISWPVIFRPLHDALIEDSLNNAERATGRSPQARPWSLRVRALRWTLARTSRYTPSRA